MARDVGGYALEELIGYGGSGEVWRARQKSTGDRVALKWLRCTGAEGQARAVREAALLVAVTHPHLVGLREVVTDRADTILVLDHLAGGSLASLLARRGRLRPGEVVTTIAPLAAALAHAHDEGLVHGDVSAGNVLFTAEGRSVLTDLGVARVLGEAGEVQATAEYVDPVVARGAAPGPASDVFGLAAVAFHALCGVPPWNAADPGGALRIAATGEPPDLRVLAPEAPPELVAVLSRALSAAPHLRGSAAELALDVRHSCRPEPVGLAPDGRGAVLRPTSTGGLTHAVRVPRSSAGPAHAAPPREPGPLRSGARGLARAAASRRGRERAAALLAVVAVTAGIVIGLRWGATNGPQQAAAVAPGPLSAVPSQPRVEDAIVPGSATEWATLLDTLYKQRAVALADADPARLAEVYTSGSPQAERDRAEIDELNAAGQQLRGFDPSVRSVDSIAGAAPVVTLLITDDFGPYDVVADGRVVESLPGRDPTRVEMTLELTAAGWRIDEATRIPESA